MSPSLPVSHRHKGLTAQPCFASQLAQRSAVRQLKPQFNDKFLGKFGPIIRRSTENRRLVIGVETDVSAPFGVHILDIIKHGAQPKMVWINACWVIAFMKYAKALGNYAYVYFVRNSMGKFARESASTSPDDSISFVIFAGGPEPTIAFFRKANFFQESFFKCLWMGHEIIVAKTISAVNAEGVC